MKELTRVVALAGYAGLLLLVGDLAAGTFVANSPFYRKTDYPTSQLIVVEGTALYVGTSDPNDRHAWIQTTLYDWWSGTPGSNTGNGYNRNDGPFTAGDLLICTDNQAGCPGRGYVPRRPCNTPQYTYHGRTAAAIYHQNSPETSTRYGSTDRPPCKAEPPSPPSPNPTPDDPCDDVEVNTFVVPLVGGAQLAQALPGNTIETLRRENRGSIEFTMDEWTILAVEKTGGQVHSVEAISASSSRYATFRQSGLLDGIDVTRKSPDGGGRWELFGKGPLESYFRPGRSILLAVDEPVHSHNDRWIEKPVPRLLPGTIPAPGDDAVALVRVEYAEDRSLETAEVLYSERPVTESEIAYLRSHLSLEYGSDKSHRAVLFAVVRLGETASLQGSRVVLPECCCPTSGPGEPCGSGGAIADGRP